MTGAPSVVVACAAMARPRKHPTVPGQVFGRLTVIGDAPGKNRRVFVRCSCLAATEKSVDFSALLRGDVTSCGCRNREVAAERARARALPVGERRPRYVKRPPRFRVDDDGRECTKCTLYKPWASYSAGNGARSHNSYCRECASAHYKSVPEAMRRLGNLIRRLRKYSLTVDQYQILVNRYGGRCWRCKKYETVKNPDGSVQRLSVDHDHACCPGDYSCGRCIRGVLCVGCNFVLGRIDGGQVDSYIVYLAAGTVNLSRLQL